MTDPKIALSQFATREEQKAKAWLGSNWVPFGLGIVLAEVSNWIIRHL